MEKNQLNISVEYRFQFISKERQSDIVQEISALIMVWFSICTLYRIGSQLYWIILLSII